MANRYIHMFTLNELKHLIRQTGLNIDKCGITYNKHMNKARNFFLILSK